MLKCKTSNSRMMKVILWSLLSLVALAWGGEKQDVGMDIREEVQGIVGGTEATPHSYPWMAAMYSEYGFTCGGTLIKGNSRHYYVLTAAHCAERYVRRRFRRRLTIYLGVHDLTIPMQPYEQALPVRRTFIHPQYNRITLEHDIALLRLDGTPSMTDEVQLATLPSSDAATNDVLTVTGWGSTSESGSIAAKLQEVDVEVQSDSMCSSLYGNEYDSNTMFCAGPLAGGKDSCQGDSGGPIMIQSGSSYNIVGVVSWGYGCARANNPGVYASVYDDLTYINSIIN